MFTSFSHAKILYLCAIPTEVKVRRDPSSFKLQRSTGDVGRDSDYPCVRSDREHATEPQSYSHFCPLVIELKEVQGTTAPFLTLLSLSQFVY